MRIERFSRFFARMYPFRATLPAVSLVLAGVFAALAEPVYGQTSAPPRNLSAPLCGAAVEGSAAFSGGTQRQNGGTVLISAFREAGRNPSELHRRFNFRADGAYGTAQKPQQPRITSTAMYYGEFQQFFDARQLFSALHGSVTPRSKATTATWVYGIASDYHHLAFGLQAQNSFGAGVSHSLASGLALSADLRHISQDFDGQADFSSWAVRAHESYAHPFPIGDQSGTSKRSVILAESLEVVQALETSDALQARALVKLLLPLTKRLSVTITGGADYMRNAPAAFKTRYWKNTVGLSYAFGSEGS